MRIKIPHNNPHKKTPCLLAVTSLKALFYILRPSSFFTLFLFFSSLQMTSAQCETEVSGIFAYCNSFIGNNVMPGYFIGFRVTAPNGDTLNVVDLAGNVPMNLGKRIDNIDSQQEPADTTRVPLRIAGGVDSVEYWYFGPFTDGDSFNIVLVDPTGMCDTIEVASGTFTCQGQDPNACGAEVPLYILDFSESSWSAGNEDGGNENVDDIFLVMSRERELSCCATSSPNERCFEFIITLDEDDIGIVIDDVGSGSTGGKIYADSLNGFACGPSTSATWPFIQDNGNSADADPICLFAAAREWIVLTCKQGANITSASIGTVGSPNVLPEFVYSECDVEMRVLNADSAVWSSVDDPNLDNLINFTDRNLSTTFLYDTAVFGLVTECLGDTFVYVVGGYPLSNSCLPSDTLVRDTTFIVVYPTFQVEIDSICNGLDSLVLTANIISPATGCEYSYLWSTGDTTATIEVANQISQYSVVVQRSDLDSIVNCVVTADTISILTSSIECMDVPDITYQCISSPPPADTTLISVGGCGHNPFIYSYDESNNGSGCPIDPLIITRYYVVDFDGDTISPSDDKDTCIQRFIYADSEPPVLTDCPANITILCTDDTDPSFTGGPPSIADNCDQDAVLGYTDVIQSGACPQEYTIARTWMGTDLCGNTSTCTQLIFVDDNLSPVISCPPNITINCSASTLPANTGTATGIDNCDATVAITFTNTIIAGICPQERTINRVWRATDDCGNSSTCLQVITVDDNAAPVILCPPNVTITCSANTNPNNTGSATAIDNCDLSVVPVVQSNTTVVGTCPQRSVITRVWVATDDCGNSSTCVQTITVTDNIAPVISCPPNITIQCTASTLPATTGNGTGVDNCDPSVTLTFTDVIVNGLCPQERTITRTWRATDDCGNSSTCNQTIVVDDSTAPVISCPPNVTLSCTGNTLPANTGTATAVDNCDLTAAITYTETITPSVVCPQERIITRTWRATDDCGNTSTCNQIITVDDSTPPSINCPANLTLQCGVNTLPANTGTATANDICDASPALAYSDITVSGNCPASYQINRTWSATDDCGNTGTCVQTIHVVDTGLPIISCPQNVTISCDESTLPANTGTAIGNDACSEVTVSYTDVSTQDPDIEACGHYSYVITRTWLAFDACENSGSCQQTITIQDVEAPVLTCATQVSPIECPNTPEFEDPTAIDNCDPSVEITFTTTTTPGSCPQEYSMTRVWTATDACGNSSTCSRTIVVEDTAPPTIVCPAVASPLACSTVPDFGTATGTDVCDPLVSISFVTDTIEGSCANGYTLVRTWTATDDCGNTASCSRSIVVEDTTPPQIMCPAVISPIECPAVPDFGNATAIDDCDASVSITFTTQTIPGACPQEYTMVRTWTATDDCGNTATCSATIEVQDNTPPVINCPNVTTPISCPANPVFPAATASDACDPSVTITFTTSNTPGPCPQERTVTRTWTATDDCGNVSTCSRSVIVEDNTPPVITCPDVISPLECGGTASFGDATAVDACDVSVTITFVTDTIPGSCPQEYSVTRTWTATDDCGNSSTCSRTVVLEDTTPPELTCPPVDSPEECPVESLNFGEATAVDACDPTPTITFTTDTIIGTCPQNYTITRTWTATDDCGNSSTCSRSIVVQDTTDPVLLCPSDTLINCTENTLPANTGVATASDNCDIDVVITYSDNIVNGSCPQAITINRTWLATDDCGNTSTCLQVIMVQDTTKPVIVCPTDTLINCTENTLPANTGLATASDNCDLDVMVTYSDNTINGSCPQALTINRTWLATDNCGNTSTCLQVIMIQDTTKPVIVCPTDTLINCTESTLPANTGLATASDNCDVDVVVTYTDNTVNGSCPQALTINRTWLATDNCGNTSTCLQVIMVQDTTKPVIVCPTDTLINCTENTLPANTGLATASDNCDLDVEVTYSDNTINGSCPQAITINRTWLATDNCGNTSTCLQVIMVQDTTKPVIVCPVDTLINCTENTLPTNTGVATASDNCDLDVVVTYLDNTVNGNCPQAFTINRTWLATDNCGNTSTCLQVIMVQDTTNPVIVCPTDTLINCTENTLPANTGLATASDHCDLDVVVTYSDNTINGSCPQALTINRTWLATDNCGNTSTCLQVIMIQDTTKSVIVCPTDTLINCTESTLPANTGLATASDNCDLDVVVTYTDNTVNGSCPQALTINRTWLATDNCGNTSTCLQVIMVQDTTKPVIVCPVDTLINCTESTLPANTGLATASDNCDLDVVVTYSDNTVNGSCPQAFTINRTWLATDNCGNTSTCLQVIMVQDTTKPVIVCPVDTLINCTESTLPANTGLATASDNCDLDVVVTYTDNTVNGSCPQALTINRTWLATDNCGNTSTCLQVIMVQDTTKPVIVCPTDTLINCTESTLPANTGLATASDNCDLDVVVTYSDNTVNGSCPQALTINRTWLATDNCGNMSTCLQVIMVQDTTKPVIVCPVDTLINCTENTLPSNTGTATASDNCDLDVVVSYSDNTVNGSCPQALTINRTWLATDNCGNTSTCLQVIMVQDTTKPVIVCPSDTLINCTENTLPVNTGIATASDNCDVDVVVTYSDNTVNGSCPQALTINRTWLATDNCGNTSTCLQVIMVQDTTKPVIVCSADTLINCTENTLPSNTGTATASDNCDMDVVVTYSDNTVNGSCPQALTINRTWLATDNCGNTSTCLQVIMVQDTTKPVIVCPSDTLINCTENSLPSNTGTATASDNCDLDVIVTYSDNTVNGSCPQAITINRTWLATDNCGNTSTCLQVIMVQDTTKPVIVCPVDTLINCTENTLPSNTGTATASDNCDLDVVVTYSDNTLIGSCPQALTINRTWLATDNCGNTSTCLQVIMVQDTTKPVIVCPVDTLINCTESTLPANTGTATASDNCDMDVVVTYSDNTLNGSCPQALTINRTWLATDNCGNTSTCLQVIMVQDTTKPVIVCPVDTLINCTENTLPANTGTATASDNCDMDVVVTYSDNTVNGSCPQALTINRTWLATDNCGNTSTCLQVIMVQDTTKPVIVCPSDTLINCTENTLPSNTGTATASDNCDLDVVVTYSDNTVNGSCPQAFTINRTWLATDNCGNTSTCLQVIMVQDTTKPVIVCPSDTLINCTENTLPSNTGTATASDNCDLDVVITYSDNTVNGSCPQAFTINRTWLATDNCGNTSTCLQVIMVQDTTKPVIICPADTLINCTENTLPANTGLATASDNCDLDVVVTYSDNSFNGSCPQALTINRTWLATDNCGNTSTCLQVIMVQDTTKPVIICPADTLINCTENTLPANTGLATASDNCDLDVLVTYSDNTINGNCPQAITINRTWLATDNCGNTSTCLQVILVQDTTKPVISCPVDTLINCTENTLPSNTGTATASDNCDMDVLVTYSDNTTNGSCPQAITINRTWIATDNCGNTSTCLQVIMVQDTTKPAIVCPSDTLINCTENTLPSNTGTATASDNCDLDVIVTYSDNTVYGSCPQAITINRTWLATDNCGNTSTCLQVIMVQDTTKPVISCPADVTILYPASTLPLNTGTATGTDNCDQSVLMTYMDSNSVGCSPNNFIYRTWIATDDCGNSSTCQQTILVQDEGDICGTVEDDLGQPLAVTVQLIADVNSNGTYDAGDTLITSVVSDMTTGDYCFTDVYPCDYILLELQPATYGSLIDHDQSPDPDGDDSGDGPDNEIPVVLAQGESDEDNNFTDIACPLVLPSFPADTICEDGSVVFQTVPVNLGTVSYTWNFGSGATPATAMGLGPHTVSYVTTTNNQAGGAIVTLTISKSGCPDLTGQVSTVEINPFPNPAISTSLSNICYYTNRNFQPVAPQIPGATYTWTFGTNAVPATATGYGPHAVYYTSAGTKTVKLVIKPNEAGAQCPDSSTVNFNVINCPANITGTVRSVSGQGIQGVNLRLYTDNNLDGLQDNAIAVRSVFTTANGSYSMVGLTPGSYVIIETQPSTWFTVDDEDTTNDGDLVPNIDSLDNLIPATVNPSEIDNSNIFIEIAVPGSIVGAAFNDENEDEDPDTGEELVGVVISLYADTNEDGVKDSSTPIDTIHTNSLGIFAFTNIPVGSYLIEETNPDGFISYKDFDATNDVDSVENSNLLDDLIPVTLGNQENDLHNYFIDRHECTLLVENLNDDGPGSLRFMIGCAISGDVINFSPALAGQTITITSTKIEIDKDIQIQSLLTPTVTIASNIAGLFDISTGKHVQFHDLNISSGTSANLGAAFYNFGILEFHDINIYKNALLPPGSPLIYNAAGSQIIINGTLNLDD